LVIGICCRYVWNWLGVYCVCLIRSWWWGVLMASVWHMPHGLIGWMKMLVLKGKTVDWSCELSVWS
jgi:hypothetical protein